MRFLSLIGWLKVCAEFTSSNAAHSPVCACPRDGILMHLTHRHAHRNTTAYLVVHGYNKNAA
jgi:hypothetical protein